MGTANFACKALLTTTLAALLCGLSSTASADDTPRAQAHHRRAQIYDRLENHKIRIAVEVRTNEMSPDQAAELLTKGRQIRDEERLMAAQHDGHLTKNEQDMLNQQEDALSREIGD